MPAARTIAGLARACHPEPTVAVTGAATALAIIAGRDGRGVAAVAATVLASQLAVGWHNDWLDADRDARTRRSDKPIPAGAVSRRAVGVGAGLATLATVALALLSGLVAGFVAIAGLVSALAYNWPLKSTAVSVLPYAISFGALPAFVVLGAPGTPAPAWWLIAAGAGLGAGAHFANTLPDLEEDVRTGVRGLPHRLGPAGSATAAAGLLAMVSALLVLGPPGRPGVLSITALFGITGVLLLGGYLQWRRPTSRAAFRSVMVAALIDVALLVGGGLGGSGTATGT